VGKEYSCLIEEVDMIWYDICRTQ